MKKVTPRPVAFNFLKRFQTSNLLYRQVIAEFFGTFILILLIDSALCVGFLTGNHHSLLYASLAGGVGLYLAFVIAATVGVGHFNPAVTISLVTLKKTCWKKALLFILAQIIGAFLASGLVYLQYRPYFLNIQNEPAKYTVNVLHSMPGPSSTLVSVLIDQIICVAILMIAILALIDKCNTHNSKEIAPIGFIFILAALILSFGLQSCAINPAREIAGRLLSTIIGLYDRSFSPLNYLFWLVSGIGGPILGGIIGSWLYYLLIEIHATDESLQDNNNNVATQTNPSNA